VIRQSDVKKSYHFRDDKSEVQNGGRGQRKLRGCRGGVARKLWGGG